MFFIVAVRRAVIGWSAIAPGGFGKHRHGLISSMSVKEISLCKQVHIWFEMLCFQC